MDNFHFICQNCGSEDVVPTDETGAANNFSSLLCRHCGQIASADKVHKFQRLLRNENINWLVD